jgi:hypothetical protein
MGWMNPIQRFPSFDPKCGLDDDFPMKHPLAILFGILLCSGGISTASAETRTVTTLCHRHHHHHWVPGHYYWHHHHRHYVPGHWAW